MKAAIETKPLGQPFYFQQTKYLAAPSSYLTGVGMSACFITQPLILLMLFVLVSLCFPVKHFVKPGGINTFFYTRYHTEHNGTEEKGQVCLTHL